MGTATSHGEKPIEIIGLMPAAGAADRISPLPCSKEVFPVGFRKSSRKGSMRLKVACHYLLANMQKAGAVRAFIVLRNGKWDIPSYLGNGKLLDMHLAYLTVTSTPGVPFTLDQAYPFVRDAQVVFGFPDILFRPSDAFLRLRACLETSGSDIVLGLFTASEPCKMDMVDIDDGGRICDIVIKPEKTRLQYTWTIAVWKPAFTSFLHEFVMRYGKTDGMQAAVKGVGCRQEIYLGDVIRSAIRSGLQADTVLFKEGSYLDIGTPEDLLRAAKFVNSDEEDFDDYR